MATRKEYLAFILDQLSEVDGITSRAMMGEYLIYHHGKIAAYLCDDRLLVKILPSTETLLPEALIMQILNCPILSLQSTPVHFKAVTDRFILKSQVQ